MDCSGAILTSAKQGIGIQEILESVVLLVPPPRDTIDEPLRALIFDSYYDSYRGVIVYFRVMDGSVKRGDKVRLMASGKEYVIDELGILSPTHAGRSRRAARRGSRLFRGIDQSSRRCAGGGYDYPSKLSQQPNRSMDMQKPNRWYFAGYFRQMRINIQNCAKRLDKLRLNDAALQYEPETSSAMGFGFRCGFLGLAAHGNRAGDD